MKSHAARFLLATVALVAGCNGSDRRPTGLDGGTGPLLGFGEPCHATEECESGLCLAVDAFSAVCTRVCTSDVDCPSGPNWACVAPSGLDARVCGCAATGSEEICGDGVDNDCDGETDDCRICDGVPVPENDPDHCGACGNACRPDQTCRDGACTCALLGTVDCDGVCVDLDSHPSHCGACGTSCGAERTCTAGACECIDSATPDFCGSIGCVDLDTEELACGDCDTSCPSALLCTSGTCGCPVATDSFCGTSAGCVDTDTHESHCGGCSAPCTTGEVCTGGSCGCAPDWPTRCGGVCVDPMDDPANCGACGNVCASGLVCRAGRCECPTAGDTSCSGTCVDTRSDPANCGACGSVCVTGLVCRTGRCECPTATHRPCSGVCVDTGFDPANCGACGNTCGPGEICSGGTCQCSSGLYCSGVCMDASDPANCGACGNVCGPAQFCGSGACRCSSIALTACGVDCVNTSSDPLNCGGCGVTCRPGESCSAGACRCPTGQTWCAGAGTCVSLSSDPANCGSCGNMCDPTETCSAGTCRCPSSFELFCATASSCVDIRSSAEHCGACDSPCPAGTMCTSSTCLCTTPGLTLCSGTCVSLDTSAMHCGSCGAACPGTLTCSARRCGCPAPTAGTARRLTTDTSSSDPIALATNGTRAGVTYRVGNQVWFGLVGSNAVPVAGTFQRLDTNAPSANRPDIVWAGTEYVVAYTDTVGGMPHLFLQRIAADGSLMGAATDVSASTALPVLTGRTRLAYSPASGLAIANWDAFQYLGPTGTTPAPSYTLGTWGEGIAIAGAPTGEWGVLSVYFSDSTFFVFNADGTLTSTPIYFNGEHEYDGEATVAHDGITWLAAYRDTGTVGGMDVARLRLRRGPALATVLNVTDIPYEGPDSPLRSISIDVRGNDILLTFARSLIAEGPYSLYGSRLARPATATAAPTILTASFPILATGTVEHRSVDGVLVTDDLAVAAWNDTRWGFTEAYAISINNGGCRP